MDFIEKINKILKTNKLQLVTKEELSEFCGFNRDTIRKAIERGTELGERYTRIFLDKLSINPEWWDTGNGDIYLKNPTPMPKTSDNNGKPVIPEVVFKDFGPSTEYRLVPKSILDEEYRLLLKSEENFRNEIVQELLTSKKELLETTKKLLTQTEQDKAQVMATLAEKNKLIDKLMNEQKIYLDRIKILEDSKTERRK